MSTSIENALAGLPHKAPFRFLNEITAISPNGGEGVWRVDGAEPFFKGHFPDAPIVPGVLITEAAAQLAGVVAMARLGMSGRGMLVMSNVRFKKHVEPPAEIRLEVMGDRVMGSIHLFDFKASVGDDVCAQGEVGLSLDASA